MCLLNPKLDLPNMCHLQIKALSIVALCIFHGLSSDKQLIICVWLYSMLLIFFKTSSSSTCICVYEEFPSRRNYIFSKRDLCVCVYVCYKIALTQMSIYQLFPSSFKSNSSVLYSLTLRISCSFKKKASWWTFEFRPFLSMILFPKSIICFHAIVSFCGINTTFHNELERNSSQPHQLFASAELYRMKVQDSKLKAYPALQQFIHVCIFKFKISLYCFFFYCCRHICISWTQLSFGK